MDKKPTTLNSVQTHFVDIHEVLPEGDEERMISEEEKVDKHLNRGTTKVRETKRAHRSFNRQVSLETGFSVLYKERNKGKDERKTLTRSGTSLGEFDSRNRIGLEGHKGDFSIFKTKSTLSKQNSLLPRKEKELEPQKINGSGVDDESVNTSVPAGRYFAALRGPELDEVKDYEDILLPKDERWPFLLRFPIGCFGICLGLSSQAVLWRALATSPATRFLHITPAINFCLWLLALAMLITVSFTYILKCIFYFEAVRREYFHP
ncbi:Voltage-dependent anion channel, partial [Sesbania bispinosa]